MPALHELLETGNDIDRLRELLLAGENPNEKDDANRAPLHIAVMKSERNPQDRNEILLVVDELIRSGANVNQEADMGYTPLHLATKCRDYRMIEKLLQANADINKKDVMEFAALHHATTGSFFDRMGELIFYESELGVVKLLLKHNPYLDIQDRTNTTPLMLAVRNGNLYIVRELLKKNASVNLKDSIGNTAMHLALDLAEVNVDLVKELARYGGSFIINNNSDMNPLNCYFQRLHLNHPQAEVEKSKLLIKLFILNGNNFDEFAIRCVRNIDREYKDLKIIKFFDLCYHEVRKMNRDNVTPMHNVDSIAVKGGFSRPSEVNSIPLVVYDRMLNKLMKGEYPVYCDFIASGICSPYINERFAKICSDVQTNVEGWEYEALRLISFYLSHSDMLNAMKAFSIGERRNLDSPRSSCFKICSIL